MKRYEIMRRLGDPFIPLRNSKARREISKLVHSTGNWPVQLLDVGGRRSPYSVGLPAEITIVDIPRESEVQHRLNLGLNERLLHDIRKDRSNIKSIILEDMTQSTLPTASFDGIMCIEVIEHVPDDEALVRQMARVLKPGGWLYLTTPNGDYVKNEPPHFNPDHVRHYQRKALFQLLSCHFREVEVTYGIKISRFRTRGMGGISFRRPYRTLMTMFSNLVNHWESRDVADQPTGTAQLFVIARK